LEDYRGDSAPFLTRDVGGIPFNVCTPQEAATWLLSVASQAPLPINVRLANAYNVALASRDRAYFNLLRDNGTNFPDGAPVVWFMNRRRGQRAGRVRGPSLFVRTLRESDQSVSHFFLGSTPRVLSQLEANVKSRYPQAQIAGSFSPPFAQIDEAYIELCASEILKSNANLVWIGLGTPKQDLIGARLSHRVGLPTVNVGAAFDFISGSVKEAPRWIQSSGFEWLYRLAREPRRLWKRYLVGNLQFLTSAANGVIFSMKGNTRGDSNA